MIPQAAGRRYPGPDATDLAAGLEGPPITDRVEPRHATRPDPGPRGRPASGNGLPGDQVEVIGNSDANFGPVSVTDVTAIKLVDPPEV